MAMTVGVRTRSGTRARRRRGQGYAYLFVLPYVLLLLAFGVGPAVYGMGISFFDTTQDVWGFNGLANYATVLQDFRLGPAVANVLLFMLIWLPLLVGLVLLLSLLLHARMGRFASVMRLIYYLPGAVAGSALVLIWIFMFDPPLSPFGPVLNLLGFHSQDDALNPTTFPGVFAVMALATGIGGWVVIVYGALTNIPHEVLEAATIDGCNAPQMALRIKLPLVAKYVVFMLILSFAGGIQLFVEPTILASALTSGTVGTTWSVNQLAYVYAFTDGNFGKSAAVSVGLLLVAIVGALLVIFKTDFYRID